MHKHKNVMTLSNLTAFLSNDGEKFPIWVTSELFPLFQKHLHAQDQLFLTVSMGTDSLVLACLLTRWWQSKRYPLTQLYFLHCNHQIRPESQKEAKSFIQFFKGYNTQIFQRPPQIKTDENALRTRRYHCFQTVVQGKNTWLLTAHHLNDRIETSFLHLIRGCGLAGFLNMQIISQQQQMRIFRPLLNISK